MNPELKVLVKKYLKLTFWVSCNFDNQAVPEDHFKLVLNEIGRLEDELLAKGIKSEQVDWLIKYVTDIADAPLIELPENQQLLMIQAIFGTGTTWVTEDKIAQ